MTDQVRSMLGEIVAVSAVLQTLAPSGPRMTADDCYDIQFVTDRWTPGHADCRDGGAGPRETRRLLHEEVPDTCATGRGTARGHGMMPSPTGSDLPASWLTNS